VPWRTALESPGPGLSRLVRLTSVGQILSERFQTFSHFSLLLKTCRLLRFDSTSWGHLLTANFDAGVLEIVAQRCKLPIWKALDQGFPMPCAPARSVHPFAHYTAEKTATKWLPFGTPPLIRSCDFGRDIPSRHWYTERLRRPRPSIQAPLGPRHTCFQASGAWQRQKYESHSSDLELSYPATCAIDCSAISGDDIKGALSKAQKLDTVTDVASRTTNFVGFEGKWKCFAYSVPESRQDSESAFESKTFKFSILLTFGACHGQQNFQLFVPWPKKRLHALGHLLASPLVSPLSFIMIWQN
jgi:hypothetical protein